jgi:hypothetical protein
MFQRLAISFILCFIAYSIQAQEADTGRLAFSSPDKYINVVAGKAKKFEEKLDEHTGKLLARLQKQEEKLKRKLLAKDSLFANEIFGNVKERYINLEKKLKSSGELSSFVPNLDSITNSLNFLQQNPQLLSQLKDANQKLKDAISKMDALKAQLSKAENVRQFIRERRQYLKEQLSKIGLAKELKKFNKRAYYYSQLIKDYKEVLNSPKKIEKHAVTLLNKVPAFRKFIEKNSFLASLFGSPSGNMLAVSFNGLQTRASVQQRIISSTTGSNGNPSQFVSQQLQIANSRLSTLKNKIAFVDLSGSPEQMPDFKPNSQKTKSFLKRLEFGANVQFGKTNRLLPSSGDFALSLGYKLNDNGIIGIGSSYKLGLGSFGRIQFTHQGFGFRSFIDWRIKSGFFFSGGYEKNYLPQLNNINLTVQPQAWQESGLVGVTKKINIAKKKKLMFQVLFDFLGYKNIPRSSPVLFRTGWAF